jgi:hypothetical protein
VLRVTRDDVSIENMLLHASMMMLHAPACRHCRHLAAEKMKNYFYFSAGGRFEIFPFAFQRRCRY